MPLPEDREKRRRQWRAGGGFRGNKPIRPMLPGEWRPGMPCHWMEQTTFLKWKFIILRLVVIINIGAAAAYLQYRVRETIAIFPHEHINAVRIYQYVFFALECLSVGSIFFRMIQNWNMARRNCVDFKQIPNDLIAPHFHRVKQTQSSSTYSNYPTIGVFIPCYNEDVDLVLETVIGAVSIDYPKDLMTIYLCDDGKDPAKRSMVSQLRKQHKNLHYVIRPDNSHAKAGNLNYSLERTSSDLVVTLDADFVPRPNIIQRLLPYYYVWNQATGLYEFNETLAVVQTPQHYRNLSPYESDPLDQRSTHFLTLVLVSKDWFNASTMIGTNNLLSRAAMQEVNYYPYHSITEDTAMSLSFHSRGYRTYYVDESLATGLATTSLWSNLSQRARWLKGDWQILFSFKGPLFARLTFFQRFMYLHMTYSRIISIVHFCYDMATVVLLIGGIPPLDAANPVKFIIYISSYIGTSLLAHIVETLGKEGLGKSASGTVAFEAIFRYFTMKGILTVMFMGRRLKFKVTDKSGVKAANREKSGEDEDAPERFDESSRMTVLGQSGPDEPTQGIVNGRRQSLVSEGDEQPSSNASEINAESDRQSSISTANDDGSSATGSEDEFGRDYKKKHKTKTPEEKAIRRKDILKNLRRIWFNIVTAMVLIGAIVYAIIGLPSVSNLKGNGDGVVSVDENVFLLAVALGFAMANLLPHLLAIYLCFIPYVSGWVMSDLIHGRCDQYAVHPRTGRLFVPWSFISLLGISQLILVFGAIIALGVFSFGDYGLSGAVTNSKMLAGL